MSTGSDNPPEIPAASQAVLNEIAELALQPQTVEGFFSALLPRAVAATGKGNFSFRPMSLTMPRSLVKMSMALRGE